MTVSKYVQDKVEQAVRKECREYDVNCRSHRAGVCGRKRGKDGSSMLVETSQALVSSKYALPLQGRVYFLFKVNLFK